MKSNYNNIIDIILTLTEDEEVRSNIAVAGSIVPYLVIGRESDEYHPDFYIYVKEKSMPYVRKKLKGMSRKYQLDIVADSTKCCNDDFGFKARYEDVVMGFFPYTLLDNILTIKTFNADFDKKEIKLKTKKISGVSKDNVIRSVSFGDRPIRVMSPEFILANYEIKEETNDDNDKHLQLLNKMSDSSVLKLVRECIVNMKVSRETKKIKDGISILSIIIGITFVILGAIAYICIKK